MVKGYKVFDANFKCRNFQFETGKRYKHYGVLSICRSGFHFCEKLTDCYNYYDFNENNKIAEIVAHGEIQRIEDKFCTDDIEIIKEISWNDCLSIVNTGKNNVGRDNTGDRNTGDSNTGDSNTGDSNTGCSNTGCSNTGDSNTGDRNTGDRNTGDRNTGDLNKCNHSSGVLCTKEQKILIFDQQSNMTIEEWRKSEFSELFSDYLLNTWVDESLMTDQEKIDHPKFYFQGGFLKVFAPEEAWKNWFKNKSEEDIELIKQIPNFDSEKFKYITGIEIK